MNDQLVLPLPGLRDWREDAALRPQPKRDGDDDWTTPACLCAALVDDVLPAIHSDAAVWEPAPGKSALVDAITANGRKVIPTTEDFRHCPVPAHARIVATNPPFNQHSAFIERALRLIDAGELEAVILLFRHDHLQSESRTPPRCRIAALNRAAAIFVCPWRPIWIRGTAGNGRWSFSWLVWLRDGIQGPRGTYWLKRRTR